MSHEQKNVTTHAEGTPESLMEHFQGPGLAKMVLVTLAVHLVLIGGTSVPYLKTELLGEDVSKLSKEKRIEKAVADATASLRKIAAANGLNPQEISDTFSPGASRAAKSASTATMPKPAVVPAPEKAAPTNEPAKAPAAPESQIEKELKKTVEGPKAPPAGATDDIF